MNLSRRLPVIFVHGAGGTAEQSLDSMAYFRDHGYGDDELYATTYGIDGKSDSMQCVFVKQVRTVGFICCAINVEVGCGSDGMQ